MLSCIYQNQSEQDSLFSSMFQLFQAEIKTSSIRFPQILPLLILRQQKNFIMIDNEPPPPKKTLCRFYLRGLCIYSSKECPFAHGVWDLDYDYYREGDEIQYDYHKSKDSIQKGNKSQIIYSNLYDFQTQKIFTLEQLNNDRQARNIVRYRLHLQLYDQFMQLLEIKHPDIVFTEDFLLREFTRAGFNKISMSSLKYNHIATYLCDNPESRFFRSTKIIPPNPQRQNILMKRAPLEEIIAEYRSATKKIIEETKQIDEGTLKKKIYNTKMAENIPPLNILLKDLKVNIKQFIQQYLTVEGVTIIPECTVQSVEKQAVVFLEKELPQRMVEWNQVFQYLSKALNSNNGNLINQVRPHLVKNGYAFLFFPMMQFLYHNSIQSHFGVKSIPPCKCNFQKPYNQEQLLVTSLQQAEPLIEGESYDIYDFETLNKCAPHILASSVLGVDLEGRLRKGGFVEMVQLNNGKNTFLFDIWHMNELGQFEAFWHAKKILRNVMVNQNIVKIFHDCRHDSIGLHEMLETCIINVFDTSAVETLISQVDAYEKLWKQQHKDYLSACKQIICNCNNVKTPGLNEIFKKYQASHGINQHKDKFHKMWSKGDLSFFCKRPIDPEYRDYCIRDVLDLPEVYGKMLSCLNGKTENIAYWVSKEYAKQGYESIIDEDK